MTFTIFFFNLPATLFPILYFYFATIFERTFTYAIISHVSFDWCQPLSILAAILCISMESQYGGEWRDEERGFCYDESWDGMDRQREVGQRSKKTPLDSLYSWPHGWLFDSFLCASHAR